MTEEETAAQYKRCPAQVNALFNLHDELDALLHANQLKSETVDSKIVTNWLRMLHNIVRDGLERPYYPFPDPGLKSGAEEPSADCPADKEHESDQAALLFAGQPARCALQPRNLFQGAEAEQEQLKLVLEKWLPQDLPGAQVEIDPVRRGFKISGIVVWPGFDGLEPIERQHILWDKLRLRFNQEDQNRITILITLSPAEYAVHREPQLV